MKLTENFDSEEFDAAGVPWPASKAANRLALARINQRIRDLTGVPGTITSAYRTTERNKEIGGSATSQHLKAEATDTVFWLVSPRALADKIMLDIQAGNFPAFGQIIIYADRGHLHISLPTLGSRNGELLMHYYGVYTPIKNASQLPLLSNAQRNAGITVSAVATALMVVAVLAFFPVNRVV